MIATIVFMFIGLILILVHADGEWIQKVESTSDLSIYPHEHISFRMEIKLTKLLD